jgi:hypothetical protein
VTTVPKTYLDILSSKLKSTLPNRSEKLSDEEAQLLKKLERVRAERESLVSTFSDLSSNVCIGYATLGQVLYQVGSSLDESLSNVNEGRVDSTGYRYYIADAVIRFQLLEYFNENRIMLSYLAHPEFLEQLPEHIGRVSGDVIAFCQSVIVDSGATIECLSRQRSFKSQTLLSILKRITHEFETFRIVLTPGGEFAYFEATIPTRVGLPVVSALSLLGAADDREEDDEDDEDDEEGDD